MYGGQSRMKILSQSLRWTGRSDTSHGWPDLTWPERQRSGDSQNDGAVRFSKSIKELWINELMSTFKKDLLTELKTEIAKQVKFVTERFESKIRDLDKKLNSLETSQLFDDNFI